MASSEAAPEDNHQGPNSKVFRFCLFHHLQILVLLVEAIVLVLHV
jgi:hypothetical protein